MLDNLIFLRESQYIAHPPKERDWAVIALKIASCIPIVGILCGLGSIAWVTEFRKHQALY